ncbi:MAG: SDR family oxidoreductase [Pseudomonadota bacterium]
MPLRRLCSPQEVASAITYLASAPAGFINGEVIDINGGIQCD